MRSDSMEWAHWIYSTYPRRAENELPREVKRKLDELHAKHKTPSASIDAKGVPMPAKVGC